MRRRPSDQLVVAVRPAICAAAMNSSSRRLSTAYCADPGKSVDGKPTPFAWGICHRAATCSTIAPKALNPRISGLDGKPLQRLSQQGRSSPI